MAKKATRLHFTEDDLKDSKVRRAAEKAEKAADKADRAHREASEETETESGIAGGCQQKEKVPG